MELWLDALAIIILAILIDFFIGDVPNAIHPLR
jgi:cobalamin biosynthesis protein CobD/CbiB